MLLPQWHAYPVTASEAKHPTARLFASSLNVTSSKATNSASILLHAGISPALSQCGESPKYPGAAIFLTFEFILPPQSAAAFLPSSPENARAAGSRIWVLGHGPARLKRPIRQSGPLPLCFACRSSGRRATHFYK